jgi:putative NADH-flavin reductase
VKLTIFGATGRIGGHVVRQALEAGHEVTAVVRDSTRLRISHPALTVVTIPDMTNHPGDLQAALSGSDAAISGIGPRTRSDVTVASNTTRSILRALDASRTRRFVAVSAAPVGPVPENEGWIHRQILLPLVRALFRAVYADLEVMEEEIERSATEWTIVRAPRLVNKPRTGKYRTAIGANVSRARAISRPDVAHAMLAVLDNPATIRQVVGVGR